MLHNNQITRGIPRSELKLRNLCALPDADLPRHPCRHRARYWAMDVASVPVAERGVSGVLSSCDVVIRPLLACGGCCSAPGGCGLSFAVLLEVLDEGDD